MNDPISETEIDPKTLDIHRALTSLREELEAIDDYNQRAEASNDDSLKALLVHNRDDEMEHAAMLMEWLRRAMPEFDVQMAKFLFKPDVTTESDATPEAKRDQSRGLGLGSLR